MRFRELRLVAFGPFTDQVIDFGEPTECDLHIVLGLNEAGKSSARRAIQALLFGFPHITPDAHVHPYEHLRVGALLDTNDGQSIELARVKARQRDLRDVADEPLDDSVLRHMLGGIDEALYDRLFLFDHDELRQGGAGLLAGGGDFGVSLFGATLGTGNLAAVRRDLHQRGEALFKSDAKARKPLLNAALHDYRDHIEQARSLSVKPREYELASARVDELARERQTKTSEVATLESEERALGRLASVTGPLARRQTVVAELEAFPDLPVLARDATTRREVALEKREHADGQLETANTALEELQSKITAVIVPDALLERAAEIQALAGEISMHEKALRDRGKLSREFETQKKANTELRVQLGSAVPEHPAAVGRALRASIEKLGDDQATLFERLRAAQEYLQECDEANDRAAKALKGATSAPDAPDAIVTWAAAAAERVPLSLAASKQKGVVERTIAKLIATTEVLSPAFDPRTRPSTEPPPAAVIAAHQSQVDELDTQFAEQRAERNRLAHQRDQLQVQLAALGADEVENTREQMISARNERDQRFAHLGDRLEEADLDGARGAHEQLGVALSQTDELADTLITQADQVHLTAEVAEIVKQFGERENDLAEITSRREELLTTWRGLWGPCSIVPLDDASAMLSWRERYEELSAQYADLVIQLSEHEEALLNSEETATELRAALESAGSPADRDLPLEQLVEHARLIVDRTRSAITEHEQLVSDANDAAEEFVKAQRAVQQAEKKLEDWVGLWAKALRPLTISAETTPTEARATIALLDDFADSEKTTADLAHRIESITADYDAFASSVRALAEVLVPDLLERDAIELIRELSRRAEVARTAATNRAQLEERKRSTLERIAELEEELSDANGVLSRLCEQAQCGTADELPAVETQVATRDRLRDELVELDKRIVEQGEQSVDELRQLLGERTGDDLAGELAAHHDTLQVAKSELETLVEEHTEAIAGLRQLDHGTEAALERENAEHTAARIGELAERYLAERVAAILLARAIEYHREHSAQPILERAQQLLPQLTANSLTRLFVDDEGNDQPVLMARRANGSELGVGGMSDGTLDQLYLALRLAALEHHLDALPPLPVLLDDILVNYDDLRVAASVPALAEVAQRTQVIVLTHHQHVATIAQDTLGDRVRVHLLGTASTP
ncbi:MAG: AAA family ATPase [Gaiellaceae bacterium]